ncbi:nucleotidyltransferase family protein [Paracoccaceae bacterium GXU_MW_L88]
MTTRPLLLFAAGFGTRMGALTADRPKPLIEVAGRPLLDHALDQVRGAGLTRAVVNTHYHGDQIAAHCAQIETPQITISHEPEILETGGGLKNALPLLDTDPVFTLNSDAVWTGANPLKELESSWRDEMGALLLLLEKDQAEEHRGPGDFFMDADGRLTRRGDAASAPYVYSGAQILRTNDLENIREDAFSLNLLWNQLLEKGQLYGAVHRGGWVDVGRPEGIAVAEAALARDV